MSCTPPTQILIPRVGIACIVENKGKILLGKRMSSHGLGLWAPPGGHLEFAESVEACAIRELQEETGLKAKACKLGPWVENVMDENSKHYITIFVFMEYDGGKPSALEPHKCEEWSWHAWDDLPSPLFPSLASLIQLRASCKN